MNLVAEIQRWRIVRLRRRLKKISLEADRAEADLKDVINEVDNFERLLGELRAGGFALEGEPEA
jgi:hypothetical protein